MFYRINSNLCKFVVSASVILVLLTTAWGEEPGPQILEELQPIQSSQQLVDPRDPGIQTQSIGPIEQQQIMQKLRNQKPLLHDPSQLHPQIREQPLKFSQLQQNAIAQHHHDVVEHLENRLTEAREQLLMAHQELEVHEHKNLPTLENGILRLYQLKHANPELLAEALESFIGKNQLRLVPDLDNKALLTYTNRQIIGKIDDLVEALDANSDPKTIEVADKQSTQSVMLRIFWLAEGEPDSPNAEPEMFLPDSVLSAVKQLGIGIDSQRLIAQSTTSLAVGRGPKESCDFNSSFSAGVNDEVLRIQSRGELIFNEQPQLDLRIMIDSPTSPIELSGNLSAPLGHYMVLGTANYVTPTRREVIEGLKEGESIAKQHTSRFAFVVQIIEADSFAPEK